MNRNIRLGAAAAALLAVAAAGRFAAAYEPDVSDAYGRFAPVDAVPAGAYSDAQIVGVLDAANQSEIDAGQLAADRSRNSDVQSFARQMVSEHTDARDRVQRAGIEPATSEIRRRFIENSRMASARLARLDGDRFDRVYLSQQVDAHRSLLRAIDEKLTRDAKSGQVSKLLREIRPAVAAHLDHAETLRKDLGR